MTERGPWEVSNLLLRIMSPASCQLDHWGRQRKFTHRSERVSCCQGPWEDLNLHFRIWSPASWHLDDRGSVSQSTHRTAGAPALSRLLGGIEPPFPAYFNQKCQRLA